LDTLTTAHQTVHELYSPIYDPNSSGCDSHNGKKVLKSGGHSSTSQVNNNFYIYYHKNILSYPGGCHFLQRRDVYRSELTFLPDDNILPLRGLFIHWNTADNYQYSLDIKRSNGETKAPCLNAGVLGSRSWWAFDGKCHGENFIQDNTSEVRVCAAINGNWSNARCSDYADIGDDRDIELYIDY